MINYIDIKEYIYNYNQTDKDSERKIHEFRVQ